MFFGQRAEVFVTEVTELLTVSGFGYRDQCRIRSSILIIDSNKVNIL